MSNLLKMVTGLMSDGMVGKVASLIGSNAGVTKTALTSLMPSILKGIASKGATESGASSLLNMIKDHGLGGKMDMSSDLMGKGSKLNDAIFGSSLKDISVPGLGGDAKSKLMNLATPMAMGSLGKVVSDKNLDAKGLSSYLQNQGSGNVAKESVGRATSAATATATQASSGGLGFLKWAAPLLLILGALWYFLNMPKDATAPTEPTTTTAPANATKAVHTHTHSDGTVHEGASHGTTTTNAVESATGTVNAAAGNVMDKAKGAAGAAGDAIKGAADKTGNVMDAAKEGLDGAAGKAGDAAGNMLDKAKEAGAAATGAAGDAVKGAVDKTGVLDAAKQGLDGAAAKGGDAMKKATDAVKEGGK